MKIKGLLPALLLTFLGCSDITGVPRTQITEIDAIGCDIRNIVSANPLNHCLSDTKNPPIDIENRPAGPDTFTVMVVKFQNPPDSARIILKLHDSLEDVNHFFIGSDYILSTSTADTFAIPPINHALTRTVTTTIFLSQYLSNGAVIFPFSDTTLIWNIVGDSLLTDQNRSLFSTTVYPTLHLEQGGERGV